MAEFYDLVTAGRQSDYAVFWQFFDNYIVTAARYDLLDELVISLYLTDQGHSAFYEKIYSDADPLRLTLFYRRRQTDPDNNPHSYKQKRLFHHLYRSRRRESQRILQAHPVSRSASEGECIGFCLYEWDRSPIGRCRILALSIDPGSDNHTKKAEIWKILEQRLHCEGVRQLETSSFQNPEFWLRNGFCHGGRTTLVKQI